MRLDTGRLLDSDLFALSTGEEFKAAVALWCKAWTQAPAGSLPADDRVLAHLSGTGNRWKKIKNMALRGWIQCADGRLYHQVVSEQVMTAWSARGQHRGRVERQNNRKRQQRDERAQLMADLKAGGVVLAWNCPMSEVRTCHANLSQPVTGTGVGHTHTGHATGHRDSHGLDGTGRDVRARAEAKAINPSAPITPTAATEMARALRMVGYPDCSHSHPELASLANDGFTADDVREAAKAGPGKPISWLASRLRGQRRDAAGRRGGPSAGAVAVADPRRREQQQARYQLDLKISAIRADCDTHALIDADERDSRIQAAEALFQATWATDLEHAA